MTSKKMNKKEGFSFVGILVSIFMVTFGVIPVLNLVNASISSSGVAKNRLIAVGLAQEGLEIVRHTRSAQGDWAEWSWYSTIDSEHPLGSSATYCVQYDTADLPDSRCDTSMPLLLDEASGLYQYILGDATPFYRTVTLSRPSDEENVIQVGVEVRWQTGRFGWASLILEDRLWRWQ